MSAAHNDDHASAAQRRRSSRACQACRLAKAKCHPVANESKCHRCLITSGQCYFLVSRRGRVKGSKNRRTLEKLREQQGFHPVNADTVEVGHPTPSTTAGTDNDRDTSHQSQSPGGSHMMSPYSYAPDIPVSRDRRLSTATHQVAEVEDEEGPDELRRELSRKSRAPTPWNPQNLVMNAEGAISSSKVPPLARKLQHILGEFPVVHGTRDDKVGDAKRFPDPLWMLLGLYERGFELHGPDGSDKRQGKGGTASPPAPYNLPEEDALLLSRWTPQLLAEMETQQMEFLRFGMFGSKCDVAHALDPIHHGLLSEERANELFEVFWQGIHSQWCILDPTFHTLDKVRSRSALLTTTILAVASTALSFFPEAEEDQVSEALRLHAHVEKLNLVVFASAARSIDIVQAHLILTRWGTCPKTRLDDHRWIRVAMIPRMAAEIGLTSPRFDGNHGLDPEVAAALRRNDIRTRAYLIINEHRFYAISGRPAMDTTQFELTDDELDEITLEAGGLYPIGLAASYNLAMIDRNVRNRINQLTPGLQGSLSLSAELEHIKNEMELWMKTWCHKDTSTPQLNWHMRHDALSCWLMLVVCVARTRLQFYGPKERQTQQRYYRHQLQEQQRTLKRLATRLYEDALAQDIHTVCTTHRAAIFAYAASIILKLTDKRDMVLRMALRLLGVPRRTFVPTFAREAAVQMMMLLRSVHRAYHDLLSMTFIHGRRNNTTRPAYSTSNTSEDNDRLGETVAETVSRSRSETSSEDPVGASQHRPDQDANMQEREAVLPTTTQGGEQHFLLPHPSISAPHQASNSDFMNPLFNFDVADFPYCPNPNQPQNEWAGQLHNTFYFCGFDELDQVVNSMSPQSYSNLDYSNTEGSILPEMQSQPTADAGCRGMPLEYSGHAACPPSACHQDAAIQAQLPPTQDGMASWRMQDMTPASSATFPAGVGGGDAHERSGNANNSQKEVIMATVGWLTQIASLMQ